MNWSVKSTGFSRKSFKRYILEAEHSHLVDFAGLYLSLMLLQRLELHAMMNDLDVPRAFSMLLLVRYFELKADLPH